MPTESFFRIRPSIETCASRKQVQKASNEYRFEFREIFAPATFVWAHREEETLDDFERTVIRHIGELRRFAISLINDPIAADDLVQESLTKALSKVRSATDIRNLRAYLFTTLHHTFVDWYRSRGNNVCLDDVLWEPAWNGSQMDRMKLRDLSRALRQLPPEHREIILLVGLSGLSYKETAEVVGVPIGTVMSRLCRGREALRQLTGEKQILPLRRVK